MTLHDQLSGDAFDISQVSSRVQHLSVNSNTFLVPWNTANGEGFIFRVTAKFCATDETSYCQLQPNSKLNSKLWMLHACPTNPVVYTQQFARQ